MRNGEPAGEPIRLFTLSLPAVYWATESGAFVVRQGGVAASTLGQPQLRTMVASVSSDKHVGPWQILELAGSGLYPDWSADGTQLLYVSRELVNGRSTVHSMHVSTGLDREVNRVPGFLDQCFWSPRPSEVYCTARRPNPSGIMTEVLSVPTNGESPTRLAMLPGVSFIQHVTADGKFLEMLLQQPVTHHRLEIATGADAERTGAHRSRDGRREFEITNDGSGQVFSVRAVGSEWKRVPGFNQPRNPNGPMALKLTPDGEWVVYQSKEAEGKFGLYRASTSTGVPERLGDFPSTAVGGWMAVSPDGRRIVLQVPQPTTEEFTLLENFLPRPAPLTSKPVAKK
jgi:Tol biopolymer transport system component